ncbi:MAG: methionine--tRNA ligase [Mycoplasmoidaceae bacterium]
MKKFYISTPIYYSSGNPHIGHAYSTILADTLARYKKLLGYETFFITGMDEHGQKIELAAKKANLSCQALVDENSIIFLKLWEQLQIIPDIFIRTTNQKHQQFVQEQFSILLKKGFIYLDTWTANYCVQCEEDIPDNKIKMIKNQKCCDLNHELIARSEESYFLKTKEFKKWISDLLLKKEIDIFPQTRVNELINSFLNDDFKDLSISRKNLQWGIPIRENMDHKIYVWIDALLNYLSGLEIFETKMIEKFWENKDTEIVHILSKEIIRFHCIYWPILLKMLSYRLPTKIISHGWIITKEGKMSKSLGNVIDPFYLINKYEVDAVRYCLMKDISLQNDTIFSEEILIQTYNTDLCNNFGNIINRSIGLIKKYGNNKIPAFKEFHNPLSINFKKQIDTFKNSMPDLINTLDINVIIKRIIVFENDINSFIENSKPWQLAKQNAVENLNAFLALLANAIKCLIFYISPLLITKAEAAWKEMNFSKEIFNLKGLNDFNNIDNISIGAPIILFRRIEENEN